MPPAPFAHRSSDALRHPRRGTRAVILWLLWLAVPLPGWLAVLGGMGWELVSALSAVVAAIASLGGHRAIPGRRGRLLLGLGLSVSCLLILGAGRATLPAPVGFGLPLLVVVLAGGLFDRRVLLAVSAALLAACVLPMMAGATDAGAVAGQIAALVGTGVVVTLAQHGFDRAAGARKQVAVLPPARPAAPGWILPPAAARPFGFMVQAELAPDGTLRLAMAGRDSARVRVTVS